MARTLQKVDLREQLLNRQVKLLLVILGLIILGILSSAFLSPRFSLILSIGLAIVVFLYFNILGRESRLKIERKKESERRSGAPVLGAPPERAAVNNLLNDLKKTGPKMINRYLVGFELETGAPLWIKDDDICGHGCIFAKTGVGKTMWMQGMMAQQMARGRASGLTFIDAKRDSGTLAQIILLAMATGRLEDLIVVDPFDPVHSYNIVLTEQRPEIKARKVLRAGLPPQSDQSTTKHYDRLAYDSISRIVRSLESIGLSWNIGDVAVALSSFQHAYPHLRTMLEKIGAKEALVELGHFASSYRSGGGNLDTERIGDNLRGISSELHSISHSEMGQIFCTPYTDLVLTEAILRGKIIYFMLPRLEEAESAARLVKLFREDLEISIGEITSSRKYNLEDPHLVIIDEGASTFGPTWANLFELARKGRFGLLFGAQSTGGLTDEGLGLSESFYERVMANVNLKIMMRIGDNRTAKDMAEWFGKVKSTKTSIGQGSSSSKSTAGGMMDDTIRTTGGESHTVNISESEDYLVSPEELKHELSAEKGLAWFDTGDGRIVKGRTFWAECQLPAGWEGRDQLMEFEKYERESLGLSDWVDAQVFQMEEQRFAAEREQPKKVEEKTPEKSGPFKLNTEESRHKLRGAVKTLVIEDEKESPRKRRGNKILKKIKRGV